MFLTSLLAVTLAAPPPQEGAEAASEPPVRTTSSGLAYQVLKEGDGGERPKMGDTVTVHYTGTLEDGTKFDSSYDYPGGQPAQFKIGQVIPGWNEGLALMSRGAKFRFTIPSDLAYGPRGAPPKIPPNATLLFDVELLDFTPGPKLPEFVAGTPENQSKTESGIVYEVLEAGDGEPPAADVTCEMNYAFWTEDGRLLDCTQQREQTVKASCEQMTLPFLKEAPQLMKPGSRVRFEVPSELAFGDRAMPGLPAGSTTVWEIELLRVIEPLPIPEFVPVDGMTLQATDSGLRYEMLRDGEGASPKMGQEVSVHYAGWLTDGTLFDSSYGRGETASFRLGQVIPGWNEGLQLMKPGALYRFVIPSDLAYGKRGSPPKIGPDQTLIFLVELQPTAK